MMRIPLFLWGLGAWAAPIPRSSFNGKCYSQVTSLSRQGPSLPDIVIDRLGEQLPFRRPAPNSLDESLVKDFQANFDILQDFNPSDGFLFNSTNDIYVAGIQNVMISGESGLVYRPSVSGQCGVVFNEANIWSSGPSNRRDPQPNDTPKNIAGCQRIPEAATLLAPYSWMYYHFVEEALPRMALYLPYLGPQTKVLTWGKPYEIALLKTMNVTASQVIKFDSEASYCIDRLLYATPTPKIEPPREALLALRTAVKADPPLPPAARDLIVIVSRSDQETRRLSNENQMMSQLRLNFPKEKFMIVRQSDTPAGLHTIEIFRRAKIILGPHGAGLSNMVFAAPGTTLIEVTFLHATPLMFWHTAAALNMTYWMIPSPGAYWMIPSMTVPVQDVIDIVRIALNNGVRPTSTCAPGYQPSSDARCVVCDVGTYSTFGEACLPCADGRFASVAGSDACRTCPEGTVSSGASKCMACPDGSSSWAGSSSLSQCLTVQQRRRMAEEEGIMARALEKLSPTLYRRRLAGLPTSEYNCVNMNDAYLDITAYSGSECVPRNGTSPSETSVPSPPANLFPPGSSSGPGVIPSPSTPATPTVEVPAPVLAPAPPAPQVISYEGPVDSTTVDDVSPSPPPPPSPSPPVEIDPSLVPPTPPVRVDAPVQSPPPSSTTTPPSPPGPRPVGRGRHRSSSFAIGVGGVVVAVTTLLFAVLNL